MSISSFYKDFQNNYRNPVYIVYSIAGFLLYWLSSLIAARSFISIFERATFTLFNQLPGVLEPIFTAVSFFGTIGFCILLAVAAVFFKRIKLSFRILLTGISTYAVVYWLKALGIRERPESILDASIVREDTVTTFGFPSGHAAMATALAIVIYQYIPRRFHRFVTLAVLLVCLSRLYLGVHLPIDLVGGFAIGLLVASFWSFVLGNPEEKALPADAVKNALQDIGYEVGSVTAAKLDARGSTPYFVTLKGGKKYFVKVVGKDNNIADWLFKITRRVLYRRLENEVPYLTPKQQLEHESYIAGLAYYAGVRTPRIAGVFEVSQFKWGQMQESISGKSLDRVSPEKLSDKVLDEIWKQVRLLHENRIIHRDLRTANVFLDDTNKPWLIDFGFSEASAKPSATTKDTVELLASLSCLVGAKRAVSSASRILGKDELIKSQAYITYEVLSSATTKALKNSDGLLQQLRSEVAKVTGISDGKIVKNKRLLVRIIGIVIAAATVFLLITALVSLLGTV